MQWRVSWAGGVCQGALPWISRSWALCTGQRCRDPRGPPCLHHQACGPQHTAHTLGWKGFGWSLCLHVSSHQAYRFWPPPFRSPPHPPMTTSAEPFGRTWNVCVCLRGAVKGKAEERMTLNPWPSVVSLCTTSQDRSCGGLSVPQFPGGGIKKCRRLVASLGTTVGKPVPQGISWAKACGVLPALRARKRPDL